jgi:transglutaminase-like putative cysteine protease
VKFALRNLLAGSFLLIFTSFSFSYPAPAANPYETELQKLHSSFSSASDLQKLALMDRIFRLRDYVSDPGSITRTFQEIDDTSAPESLIHSEAEAYLSDIGGLLSQPPKAPKTHWYQDAARRTEVLAQAARLEQSATNLEILAELEHTAGAPQAADLMLRAAQLEPTPERRLRVGIWTEDQLQRVAFLQNGLALDPHNAALSEQLALYYIGRQQLEKAHDLLLTALAAHPDDFVLGERLAGLYLNLGLRSAALQQLRTLEQLSPAPPADHAQNQEARAMRPPGPIWLRARLALDFEQIGLLEDAARLAESVIRDKSSDREQLQLLARFHERREMVAELKDDYAALLRLQPDSSDLWLRLARLQHSTGDLNEAKDSFLRVIALNRGNAEAHRDLAAIYEQLHLPEAAKREKTAEDAALHNRIAAADQDSELLRDTKKLAAETFLHPPSDDDIALADIRVQELYKNGLSRLHIQQIFYVGSEGAIRSHRTAEIRYAPGSEAVHILHARDWKRDGTVLEAQEDGEAPVGDSASSMYYDVRSRKLRFNGVEKGDVIELEYEVSPTLASSPYTGYFGELVMLAGRAPARLKRYALIVPSEQAIFAHAEKVSPVKTTEKDGRRTMVWDAHDVAALPREPHSPGATEVSPYVHVSTMSDWEKLGSWYADLIRPQFALDESLKNELERITRGKDSETEKIAAIQEFVLRSTHYVAMEFGVYSYKPYAVSQTYARRFGDCKDKASLMIALLQAAGIDAEIALVRTRSLGDVAPVPASVAIFDHAIVYIPKYKLWLDGTAEYSGTELPQEDQGAMALTVSLDGSARLRQVPVTDAAENYTKRTIHAELTRQGLIRFNGSTLTRGKDAPQMRRDMAVREQQLGLFREGLAEVFPTVELDSVAVHGADQLGKQVSVDFEGAMRAFQHQSVVTLNSSWIPRSYVSTLAPTSTRNQDLLLNLPSTTEEEIHIDLPSGSVVRQLPSDQEIKTAFGSARLHYAKSAHEIVIQSHLEFDKGRISVQEYPAFRQFCSSVERSFGNEIIVGLAQ